MKKILFLFALILVIAALLISCGEDPKESNFTLDTSATTASSSAPVVDTDIIPAGEDGLFSAHLIRNENHEIIGVGVLEWKNSVDSITVPSSYEYQGQSYPITRFGYGIRLLSSDPTQVRSILIPSSVKTISTRVCMMLINLETVTLSEGLEKIDEMAFWHCTSLRGIAFPSTLKSIGNEAFDDCFGLTTLVIPSGVTEIGDGAFAGCTGLKTVTIPAAFRDRVGDIFRNCGDITFIFT